MIAFYLWQMRLHLRWIRWLATKLEWRDMVEALDVYVERVEE